MITAVMSRKHFNEPTPVTAFVTPVYLGSQIRDSYKIETSRRFQTVRVTRLLQYDTAPSKEVLPGNISSESLCCVLQHLPARESFCWRS